MLSLSGVVVSIWGRNSAVPVGRYPSLGLSLDPVPDAPRAPLLPLLDLLAIKLPFRAAFEDISALLPLELIYDI